MRILAGTSGWSYAPWKGPFYPPDLPSARMLAWYAAHLPTVEVNATFHRMPRAEQLASWRAQVPAGFRFALKAPQRITHFARLAGVEEPVRAFLGAAAELGDALGPVLWQLPPSLRKDVGRLSDLLALLPRGARAAFEFRHPTWLDDEVLALLAGAGAALCVADTEEGTTPLVATGRFGYLRLRRPDYGDADLARWLERIRGQAWDEAWVFFKHEDEARGPAFALRLAALGGDHRAAEYPATR